MNRLWAQQVLPSEGHSSAREALPKEALSFRRIRRILLNDVRYQMRYGFYLIYAILTLLYIAGLGLISDSGIKSTATAFVLLSDPAVLGYFFIGGIWLLEKDEGLHGYLTITPTRIAEYVIGKALSLGFISTLSALAICGVSFPHVNVILLTASIFIASSVFTLLGLSIATKARSVNGYLLASILPAVILMIPAILTILGIYHPTFAFFPGTMALQLILEALQGSWSEALADLCGLVIWSGIFFTLALRTVSRKFHLASKQKARMNSNATNV